MSVTRRPGALAGVLYLVTHVTSVGAVILYGPLLTDHEWLLSTGSGTPQLIGALLDILLALAVAGTAIALFPVIRRYNERGAVAYLSLRTLEGAVILIGATAVMAVVSLRDVATAADQAAVGLVGEGLAGLYRATFLVGPGLVVPFHTVILAAVLLRHRLVPTWITVLGLVGGPLVFISNLGVMYGAHAQTSATAMAAAIPIFAWEISLALFLIIRGLRTDRTSRPELPHEAAVPIPA